MIIVITLCQEPIAGGLSAIIDSYLKCVARDKGSLLEHISLLSIRSPHIVIQDLNPALDSGPAVFCALFMTDKLVDAIGATDCAKLVAENRALSTAAMAASHIEATIDSGNTLTIQAPDFWSGVTFYLNTDFDTHAYLDSINSVMSERGLL